MKIIRIDAGAVLAEVMLRQEGDAPPAVEFYESYDGPEPAADLNRTRMEELLRELRQGVVGRFHVCDMKMNVFIGKTVVPHGTLDAAEGRRLALADLPEDSVDGIVRLLVEECRKRQPNLFTKAGQDLPAAECPLCAAAVPAEEIIRGRIHRFKCPDCGDFGISRTARETRAADLAALTAAQLAAARAKFAYQMENSDETFLILPDNFDAAFAPAPPTGGEQFKKGDRVRIKTGGPAMVFDRIYRSEWVYRYCYYDKAVCDRIEPEADREAGDEWLDPAVLEPCGESVPADADMPYDEAYACEILTEAATGGKFEDNGMAWLTIRRDRLADDLDEVKKLLHADWLEENYAVRNVACGTAYRLEPKAYDIVNCGGIPKRWRWH